MNILVCIKQVPDTAEIRLDPATNNLVRDGTESVVNPFDAYALELAARLKDASPGSRITLLSMGPEQVKTTLRQCLAVGGDSAWLICGPEFRGSDTMATAYALSRAAALLEESEGPFDLILCGKQSVDGETAQVGPMLAEALNLPQVTGALNAEAEGSELCVRRETDDGWDLMLLPLPCLVTVAKSDLIPRLPSIKSKMAAMKAPLTLLSARELKPDKGRLGLGGSPTVTSETCPAPKRGKCVFLTGGSVAESAARLAGQLSALGIGGEAV